MTERVQGFMTLVFGGDVPAEPLALGQVAARAAVVYVVGLVLVRLGKSRLIGHATPLDVILGFILGSILSRGITGSASISSTAVASAVLVAAHWLFTGIAFRSHAFGKIIKGNSYILVENGEVNWTNMRRAHISEQDLLEAVRMHGQCERLDEVKIAYKERNGEISVIGRRQPRIVDVQVADGVQTVRIELAS